MSAPPPRNRFCSLHQSDRGAVALLVLIFFGLNLRLLTGEYSEQWDGEIFFAPFYHHVASLVRSGHLLGWNPFCSGGSPDFAEPQVGAFSPVTLLFGLVAGASPFAFHLYWLCVWLLGGLGMYVLARALAAPPWGALVTSLGFVLGGFYLGHGEHTSVVYTFSFVPWVLWRVRAALTTGRAWAACEAGALWGLSALAGNPAVHVPAALFIGVISLAWLPTVRPGTSRWLPWRTYALSMLLLAGVGLLVLAPAYVGFRYEAAGYSHRALPLPRSEVLGGRLGFGWLTALATPFLVSFDDTMPAWADFDVSMRLVYFGATVPVFAAYALWRRRACGRTWVVLVTALLCLGVSMGSSLPLRAWLYDLVPPTRFFRHAPMFRGFFVLAAAMLAAQGTALADAWRSGTERGLRPFVVVAAACALVGVGSCVGISFFLTDALWAQLPLLAPCHLALAWTGPAVLGAAAVRWPGVRRRLPGALVALTALDLGVAHAFTSHVAYQHRASIVATAPIRPLVDLGADGFDRAACDLTNASLYDHQTAFASYTAMRNEMQAAWARIDHLRPYVIGRERVWFAAGVPTVPATPEAFRAFVRCSRTRDILPVVRQTRAELLRPGAVPLPDAAEAIANAPAAQGLDFTLLVYRDNDLSLRVTCPADGFLLLTDRWSRSWQATVNGRPVPIDGGDFLFRLVPVRAGENLVAMHYALSWAYALLALSWGTLAVVAGGTLWRWHRAKKVAAADVVGIRPALREPAAAVV